MKTEDLKSLYDILPFSLLPESEFKSLKNDFAIEQVSEGTVLFEQEKSVLKKVYILKEGEADRYFEESREKTLRGGMGHYDIFGAISILMNDSICIRTLKVTRDAVFYTLDARVFLRLCASYAGFKAFFVNIFNKQSLNASYRYILDRQIKEQDFTLPFFNQPVYDIFRPNLLTCTFDTPIKEAVEKLDQNRSSCIFVRGEDKRVKGIVTFQDIVIKVVGRGHDVNAPVTEIMSSPLISIQASSQVFEAFITLTEKRVRHLAVSDSEGRIIGGITGEDLVSAQSNSPYLLIREIKTASRIDELENIQSRLPRILLGPIKNGANPEHLTRLITTFSDAILERIIHFALEEAGPAPCEFVFMIMGSEGRREQTLKTDQDNAIIYEDIDDPARQAEAESYFAMLADFICTWLDKAGFTFCDGDNMASNPKWCQPLSVWKQYFFDWTHAASPEDLLYSSIFFDFRGAWGNMGLTRTLQDYLYETLTGWSGFFRNLTENALHFKPPISFFKNFVVETEGDHKGSLDIKRAMLPIIDAARLYALKHQVAETNTLSRLFRLYTRGAFTPAEYHDMVQAYNYMTNLRFTRQITAIIDEEREPDNYINPSNLSSIDQVTLKECFKKIENVQNKLNMEFIGIA